MSLKSTRGRFSNDEKKSIREMLDNIKKRSAISDIGRKPVIKKNEEDVKKDNKNLDFNISKTSFDTKKNNFKENSIRKKQIIPEINNKKEKYEKEDKKVFFEDEKYGYDFVDKKNKKTNVPVIVLMAFAEIITLVVIFTVGTFIRLTAVTPKSNTYNKTEVKNTNISNVHLETMKGYKTIAIFGLDNRDDNTERGNADVCKILNLNKETGELKIITVYRDLYVHISGTSHYGKLNSAYAGGATRAIKTLNENLDLNITDYITLNWKAVAMGIDFIGGIDLEITRSEYKYFNAFVHEVCVATGIDKKNPALHYIKKSGFQHLDGVQAVAYARLRLTDSDFQRVERQNKVMSLAFEKVKKLSINEILSIAGVVLQEISYEFDWTELISLIPTVVNINMSTPYDCPELTNIVTQYMGSNGDCVVPNTLETAVKKLHKEMFGEEDYKPSRAVVSYSNRINELRRQYKEENDKNANDKETSEEKDTKEETKTSVKSETKKQNVTAEKPNNTEPVTSETYEEEPEEETTTRTETRFERETNSNAPVNRPAVSPTAENTNVGQAPGSNTNIGISPGGNNMNAPTSAPTIVSPTESPNSAVVIGGPPG